MFWNLTSSEIALTTDSMIPKLVRVAAPTLIAFRITLEVRVVLSFSDGCRNIPILQGIESIVDMSVIHE